MEVWEVIKLGSAFLGGEILKTETIAKVLKRHEKGLRYMARDCPDEDRGRYEFDADVFKKSN